MFFWCIMLWNLCITLIFPKTPLETYIDAVLDGAETPPAVHAQLLGQGIACFSYRYTLIRALIHRLKYHGDTRVAQVFAQALTPVLIQYLQKMTLPFPYIITGIPLTRRREWWRGFNQANLIADEIARLHPDLFIYEPAVLRRIKHKTPQARIRDPATRLLNAHGLFAMASAEAATSIHDKPIILVDDVITTGATLRSATRILEKARSRHVVWLALAH